MTIPSERVSASTVTNAKPLFVTACIIWLTAVCATAVPVTGFAIMMQANDVAAAPSWLASSLVLFFSLPAAVLVVFAMVFTTCLLKRVAMWESFKASVAFAVGGLFAIVAGLAS
jgi:hypothetical protein